MAKYKPSFGKGTRKHDYRKVGAVARLGTSKNAFFIFRGRKFSVKLRPNESARVIDNELWVFDIKTGAKIRRA